VSAFLRRLGGPDAAARAGAAEELRLAESQERWVVRIAFVSVALGLAAGGFSFVLGLAIGLPGFIFAMWLRADAAFARMSVNQRAIIELQRKALIELAGKADTSGEDR
jgi:hypothetical protein